ncbi:MAG: zinc-ribbon domain-containing protein [Terriglobales bacterium]
MPISCGYCGASMPDIAEFCPTCGRPVREGNYFAPEEPRLDEPQADTPGETPPVVVVPAVEWNDRWVGALAYFTFIPALLFLFLKQFQRRKFVRFHAFQSIFFWAAVVVLLLLGLLASTFGWLFVWLLMGTLIGLALFFTWLLLSIKALQGEWFGLPVLGALAEQRSGR